MIKLKVKTLIVIFVMLWSVMPFSVFTASATDGASVRSAEVINITNTSYTVTCKVSSNTSYVLFPSWAIANNHMGGSATWYRGSYAGGIASFTVPILELGTEFDAFITHIYAYDGNGKSAGAWNAGVITPHKPQDLGNEFVAKIKNPTCNKYVTKVNENIEGIDENDSKEQLWHFMKIEDYHSQETGYYENIPMYKIKNCSGYQDMDVAGASSTSGTNVQMCDDFTYWNDAQMFYIYNINGSYYFKAHGCMKVILDMDQMNYNVSVVTSYTSRSGSDAKNAKNAQSFSIEKVDAQDELPVNLGEDFYANIVNQSTNLYLTSQTPGEQICGTSKNSENTQLWHFQQSTNGSYIISDLEDGHYMDVDHIQDNDGAEVHIYTGEGHNGGANQKFYIYHNNNTYYFRPANSFTRVLNVSPSGNHGLTIYKYGDESSKKFDLKFCNLSSLSITSQPSKKIYFCGDKLDLSGLKLKAIYTNEISKEIDPNDCEITGFDTLKAGTQTITISYTDRGVTKTTSFTVTVKEPELTKIEISGTYKDEYFLGDDLNAETLSGMIVTAYEDNSNTYEVDLSECTISGYDSAKEGTQTITIRYQGKEATFSVTVKKPKLDSITSTLPTTTTYSLNETFDPTGLQVTATYEDKSIKNIDIEDCNITGFDSSSAGDKYLTISYTENNVTKSCKITITIKNCMLTSITVNNTGKLSYFIGDSLDTSGLIITAHYSDNSQKNISTSLCSIGQLDSTSEGTKSISVQYQGKTASFEVSVSKVTLSNLTILSMPSKITYYLDEDFDKSGLVLCAIYNNGNAKVIDANQCTVSGYSKTTLGKQQLTAIYQEDSIVKSVNFEITVQNAELVNILIKTNPSNTTYYVGDTFSASGLTLTAEYINSTTKTIQAGSCTYTGYDMNKAGTQTVTVSYTENGVTKTISFNITVNPVLLNSVSINSNPSKTSYYIGDIFSSSGLTLTAKYNNNTTQTISADKCTFTGYDMNKAGTQTVTVSYTENGVTKTISFNITVNPVLLNSVSINSNPSKTSYYIGDTFSSSGLTLTATYSNNATQTISADKCTFTGYDMNKAGTQTVTVSYTEGGVTKSTNFTITVNEKSDPTPTPTPDPTPTPSPTPDNNSTAKLSSISIKTKPNKTKYSIGQSFSSAGLTVTARYSDGTSKTLSAGSCSIKGYNKGKTGTQKITVSYGGKTTSFTVSVKGLPKATLTNVKSLAGSKILVSTKSVKGINGYECQISTSKTFTKNTLKQKKKTVKFKSILPMFSHKRIYIKCRTYKKVGSKIYYGAWSNIRTTTMK